MRKFIAFLLLICPMAIMAQSHGFNDVSRNATLSGKAAKYYSDQEKTRYNNTEEERLQYNQILQEADGYYRTGEYSKAKQRYQEAKSLYLQLHSNANADLDTKALDEKILDADQKSKTAQSLKKKTKAKRPAKRSRQ